MKDEGRKTSGEKPLGRPGNNSFKSEHGLVVSSCEHSNEPSGSIKGGGFPDWLKDYQFLTKTPFHGVRVLSIPHESDP
jgi:hypothetical protein